MKYLLPLLAFVASCAPTPEWTERPVPVYLGEGFPPECLESVELALAFWYDKGVDYLVLSETEGVIRYGILVVHADLPGSAIGRATLAVHGFAMAELEVCGGRAGLQVAAHEFGHLLGLDHVDDPTNLMNPWIAGGGSNLGLTAEQIESVR